MTTINNKYVFWSNSNIWLLYRNIDSK